MDNRQWISLRDRKPTEADGDAQKCVLVWHSYAGALIYNVHNIHSDSFITHWMKLPGKPEQDEETA